MAKVLFWEISSEGANFWFAAANALLLMGAIAVAVGTYGVIAMGGAKQHYADARIAENEAKTAQALQRAAEANLKAEQEKLARLRIEERLAPRALSVEQQRRISERLSQFAGQRFQFVSYQDDPEVRGLVNSLVVTLSNADWEGVPVSEFLMASVVLGVTIQLPPSTEEKFRPAAEELAKALNDEGISSRIELESSMDPEKSDRIRIKVGKKA